MLLWLTVNGVLLILAYLLGSFPTGYLMGKWLKGIDMREQGSGSTGATNVLRTLGKGPAIAVLVIDMLKGVLAIAIVQLSYSLNSLKTLIPPELSLDASSQPLIAWTLTLTGLAALLGHSKPIWLSFQGGKSVATSLGVLLALSWQVAASTLGVFAAVFALSRIVSLSSIAGAISVSVWMYVFKQPLPYLLFAIVGGIYVIWRHSSNIQRLLAGTEPQLGQKLPE